MMFSDLGYSFERGSIICSAEHLLDLQLWAKSGR